MAVELILPPSERNAIVDLKANYYRQVPLFYGALVVLIAVSLARPLVLWGEPAEAADIVIQLIFLLLAITAIAWRNEKFHAVLAPTVASFELLYIGMLFIELR